MLKYLISQADFSLNGFLFRSETAIEALDSPLFQGFPSSINLKFYLFEGSGSFQRKPMIIAGWMIATEIGCCLRPLGIVRDEQLCTAAFI